MMNTAVMRIKMVKLKNLIGKLAQSETDGLR